MSVDLGAASLRSGSLASNTANSIRDRKGKPCRRGTKEAWKGTELGPGCGGCVHRHGRGSIFMAYNQQTAQQMSKDSIHWYRQLGKLQEGLRTELFNTQLRHVLLCLGLGWCFSVFYWGCSSVTAAGAQHSFIFEIYFIVLRCFVSSKRKRPACLRDEGKLLPTQGLLTVQLLVTNLWQRVHLKQYSCLSFWPHADSPTS